MVVSICMITYNHEDYIKESIDSVLAQVTDFSWQLVIGEDNSRDRTGDICREYASRFPDKIKLVTSSRNVGMMNNFFRTYKACEGKYIAFSEGDDYWTDPSKLQKQVDFMEENPDYSGCFHNVIMKIQSNGISKEWVLHKTLLKDSFVTEDVLGPWFIPSPSFMFVNYRDFVLPEWFFHCQYGDLPFMLLLSLRGKFKYIDEVMGVYRKHEKGLSEYHKAYDKIMVMLYIYTNFNAHTQYRFNDVVRKAVIYEIERHIPSKGPVGVEIQNGAVPFWKRYYHKIKKVLSRDY